LRPAHAHDVVLILPSQANRDRVLAINRKVIANRHAAARSKRQVFALLIVLDDMQRNLESIDRRNRWAAGQRRGA
jgi:hypothetical protein